MAVVLPSGWTNFQGGGSNPALCDQGIPPSISIPSGARSFNCTEEIFEILLEVLGGVPPFTWETTRGRIEVTGLRTSTVFLHNFQSENTVNCGALGIRNDDHAYRRTGFAEFSLLDLGPRGQLIGNGIVYNCNNEPVTGADRRPRRRC